MKLKRKAILLALLVLTALVLVTGCAKNEDPYLTNDEEGYNVSIKFDANGGFFTTNTSVIVDSYNLEALPKDAEGNAQIALLSPDDSRRGKEAFKADRAGYFLAGWYAKCTTEGDTVTYADKWDFEKDVHKIKAAGEYTSSEPVLTLYAAWVPLFEIEVYDRTSGEKVGSAAFSPLENDMAQIQLPAYDQETGAMSMGKFPVKEGYTWGDVYLTMDGTNKVDAATVAHSGTINYDNATVTDRVMKLYVDYKEGNWYEITSAAQLGDIGDPTGHYILKNDLDFSEEIWPTAFMHGTFTGSIIGNGHTISNVSITQNDASQLYTGLFGNLTEGAELDNVTFENVILTVTQGPRTPGSAFGVLAGAVSEKAVLEGVSVTGKLIISFEWTMTNDYVIGLVFGIGEADVDSTITCEPAESLSDTVHVTIDPTDGNTVIITFGDATQE